MSGKAVSTHWGAVPPQGFNCWQHSLLAAQIIAAQLHWACMIIRMLAPVATMGTARFI